jgi:flagellar protein FliS
MIPRPTNNRSDGTNMTSDATHEYLANQVLTAPPQKLQLLLIEAAIRRGEQVRRDWARGADEAASEGLLRCQEIVAQLLSGLSPDRSHPLVRQVAALYTFVFRSLVRAHLRRDEKALGEALAVLAVERQTWQDVCARLGDGASAGLDAAHASSGPHPRPVVGGNDRGSAAIGDAAGGDRAAGRFAIDA